MTSSAEPLLAVLASRARGLARGGRRAVLGITGAPGSGKTTFADALAARLRSTGREVARVPMDGFHLADDELSRLGRLDRKGAPDTFDTAGYASLLGRCSATDGEVVYAPSFDRRVGQPIAGSIPVPPSAELLITEGNYLLFDGEWARAGEFLTETWYVEVDEHGRRRRLVARHVAFGKPAAAAREWAARVDQRNADLVASYRHRADLVVDPDRGQAFRPGR
ncbi:nucleoside/nucleotide kinase family protein [Umezawaea tangerina]|uniref:ArgK protein n=1 Tax=Umezawaea tangerina TaxID=84725 RepID=A0A2T0STZ5_9PSEU|nr:nucleoside/nucleotide kinase family protein [Umezawaea tangerina]PRY36886.1 ArgK protein [Umezawaea tangerina]